MKKNPFKPNELANKLGQAEDKMTAAAQAKPGEGGGPPMNPQPYAGDVEDDLQLIEITPEGPLNLPEKGGIRIPLRVAIGWGIPGLLVLLCCASYPVAWLIWDWQGIAALVIPCLALAFFISVGAFIAYGRGLKIRRESKSEGTGRIDESSKKDAGWWTNYARLVGKFVKETLGGGSWIRGVGMTITIVSMLLGFFLVCGLGLWSGIQSGVVGWVAAAFCLIVYVIIASLTMITVFGFKPVEPKHPPTKTTQAEKE